MMMTLTVSRNFRVIYGFSLFMFLAAFISLVFVLPHLPHYSGELLVFDKFGILFLSIIIASSLIITVFSYLYFKNHGDQKEEYFIILFIASLGASIIVLSGHFISFFLGLETLSISLYILIAYIKYRDYSVEAGVKFLVIASVSTAFLLFGMALLYASSGTMTFSGLAQAFEKNGSSPLLLAGAGLIIAGIGFKLALVPFHMWAPDVYQGSPAPVTSFIATISKGAVFALALRFFVAIDGFGNSTVFTITSIVAILSMFAGNLLALRQSNLKRLLAYSSIAHMGYLLITLLTGTDNGIQSAIFYLVSYILTTLAAFGVISLLSTHNCDREDISDLKGLFYNKPWIAVVLSLTMFSLAGIPLTAGFIAKFYIVLEGIRSDLWLLAFSLIINTVISLYYYLSVIKTMFTRSDDKEYEIIPIAGNIVLAMLAIGILLLGIVPSLLTKILEGITI
jgi:NADH-quinone oxidoreductase subunit N